MNKHSYLSICMHLIIAELTMFKERFINDLIDKAIWASITISVMNYIMPHFGLSTSFGPFQFGGVLATVGLFELFGTTFRLVADLEGDRIISYQLTLPLPTHLAIISRIISYACTFIILALCMLPIGKLCLWNKLNLATISYGKLLIALTLQSIFYGCAIIWITSFVKYTYRIGTVWSRFIFPLWFLGGFQFSWHVLYDITPQFALIDLINPIVYITESTRAALLGQEGFINFWLASGMLVLFIIACGWHGLYRIQKQLDYV